MKALKDGNVSRFTESVNEGAAFGHSPSTAPLPKDHPFNECIVSEDDWDDGKTHLFIACESEYPITYLDILLGSGVLPDLYNEELELFPLHHAARQKNSEAMYLLLQYGADVNVVIRRTGQTALHICIEKKLINKQRI